MQRCRIDDDIHEACDIHYCDLIDTFQLNSMIEICLHEDEHAGRYVDDVTGFELDKGKVAKPRCEELAKFKRMQVYTHVLREVVLNDKEGKLVGTRWVDVLKNGEVKSRRCVQ